MKDRGWQEALQAMYPAKINEFVIEARRPHVRGQRAGAAAHAEGPRGRRAQDVRNVRSDPDVYPSPIEIKAIVFDEGRLAIQGKADFLRVPHLG